MNLTSIIICTKGRYSDLKECLYAIRNQKSLSPIEVIIVDGDGDPAVQLFSENLGFIYINQKMTSGKMNTPAARNLGIKNSTGDIIIFIDDDAIPAENWLSSIQFCYANKRTAAVGGPVISFGSSRRMNPSKYNYPIIKAAFQVLLHEDVSQIGRVFDSGLVTENWSLVKRDLEVDNIVGTNMSFRRECFVKVGLFDQFIDTCGLRDETDLCVRLRKKGAKIVYCSNALVYHKLSAKGTSIRRLYYSYFTEYYFLVKNRDFFRKERFLIREILLFSYLFLKAIKPGGRENLWKYALKGRIDAYRRSLSWALIT